eukprot:TRINITY_DN96079_c0_g1_i1.p2 TRINITY_DN96079_c0_g1~~TRINITY_DN96079_c0_g1_i1.p2  ORF type:complete len:176 (-),score=75.39 TRINITY_DN96079_c0_g1_i1:44-538(-)
MGKRWRPPEPTPAKPRMDKTASEYVAEMKQQEEAETLKKKGSLSLAQYEKEFGDPDNNTGAIKTPAEMTGTAGPAAPKKSKKEKKKEKKKDKKKDKKKKDKKKKEKKKKSSSSSSSDSGSDSSDENKSKAKGKLSKKQKKAATTAATGWKYSNLLRTAPSDSDS